MAPRTPTRKKDPRDSDGDGKVSPIEAAIAEATAGSAGGNRPAPKPAPKPAAPAAAPAGGAGLTTEQILALIADAPVDGAGGAGGDAHVRNPRGPVLLPYEGVDNYDTEDWKNAGRGALGAYRTKDALAPASSSWSPEKLAGMQRTFANLGLYGNKTVIGGTYDALTQAIFTKLLQEANVSGRTWTQQLDEWKIRPPVDVTGEKKTIHRTDPRDIREAAGTVDTALTGGGHADWVNNQVAPYQGMEVGSQNLANADAAAGGGGDITDPPSGGAFLRDRMRKEMPLEVGAWSFREGFNQFVDFIKQAGA